MISYVVLDDDEEPTTLHWDSAQGERCRVTRDEHGHFNTWRIVDASGATLRQGTWRTETGEDQ